MNRKVGVEWDGVCVRVGTSEGFVLNAGMNTLTCAWGKCYSGWEILVELFA